MTTTKSGSNFAVIGLIAGTAAWRWQDSTVLNYTRCNINDRQKWYHFDNSYTSFVCKLNGYDNSRVILRDSACPKGTIKSPDNKNICYQIYADPSNWYAAEQTCQKGNGHLVSIHNSNENSYLLGVVPFDVPGAVDFWTGSFYNSTWKWSDNTPFDFSNWAPGNPQSVSGLCMSEKVRSGYWYSSKCDDNKPFICAVPPANTPRPSCPPNFSYYDVTKKCYQVSNILKGGDASLTNFCV
uniref:C-type lectin domain-containing protein n=1 Tax=Panagrolaimus superbus TaxID=310955 RepID=A0A914YXX6_9BILA